MSFLPPSQFRPVPFVDWPAADGANAASGTVPDTVPGDVPGSGVEKNAPPVSVSEPLPPTPSPVMPSEQVQISEVAAPEVPPIPAVSPLLSDPPANTSLPLGKAAAGDVLHLIAPAVSPLDTPLPASPLSNETIKVPAPSGDQIVNQTGALVNGTILTIQAIQDKVSTETALVPLASQPLIQGVAVSTVAPMISSGRKNLQDLISGEKTVGEAVGAVASDAMDAVVTGAVSNVGQKLISGVASAFGAPPATAEAVGIVAAFTSARLSTVVLDGSGAKFVVMDQTKNWLDGNLKGTPSPLPTTSLLNTEPLLIEPLEIKLELPPLPDLTEPLLTE